MGTEATQFGNKANSVNIQTLDSLPSEDQCAQLDCEVAVGAGVLGAVISDAALQN